MILYARAWTKCSFRFLLRGQGQGWVLLDSPACRGVLLDSTPCSASRGTSECYATGVGPTVTRDTRGSRVGPSPGPGPLIYVRKCLIMLCWSHCAHCAALRAAFLLRNRAALRAALSVMCHLLTNRLAGPLIYVTYPVQGWHLALQKLSARGAVYTVSPLPN